MEQKKRIRRSVAVWKRLFSRQSSSGLSMTGVLSARRDQRELVPALAIDIEVFRSIE